LQEQGLIKETKDVRHSQKKIKILTDLGQEMAELISQIDFYREASNKLRRAKEEHLIITQKFGVPIEGDKQTDSVDVEQNKALKTNETSYNQLCAKGLGILEYQAANIIKDLAIFRYASLLKRFNVSNTTRIILNQIITDITSHQIEVILDNIEEEDDLSTTVNSFDIHAERIGELPSKLERYGVLSNVAISTEAKELLLSVASVLKSSKAEAIQDIELERQIVELAKGMDETKIKLGMRKPLSYAQKISQERSQKRILTLYEEIMATLS
jgi:hypothetical protein